MATVQATKVVSILAPDVRNQAQLMSKDHISLDWFSPSAWTLLSVLIRIWNFESVYYAEKGNLTIKSKIARNTLCAFKKQLLSLFQNLPNILFSYKNMSGLKGTASNMQNTFQMFVIANKGVIVS